MNEEINILSDGNSAVPASDPLPSVEKASGEEPIADPDPKGDGIALTEQSEPLEEETSVADDASDPCLPAAPVSAADPDSGADAASDTADRLDRLQAELMHLREQLSLQTELFNRIDRERTEFGELYPDVPLDTLPDAVWSEVEKGIPLAAAFALSERKRAISALRAEKSNLANSARTVGGVTAEETEYFSSDEVRAMSREEIHKNYSKIMESMKRWH